MKSVFGAPCAFTTSCSTVTNSKLKPMIETRDVGPFRVTGMKLALDRLQAALDKVKAEKPDLYAVLGTAGR